MGEGEMRNGARRYVRENGLAAERGSSLIRTYSRIATLLEVHTSVYNLS